MMVDARPSALFSYSPGEDPVSLLTGFGLTRQEAVVYMGLLSEGELNGYEAAKSLNMSRSNAYTALASLVEKGAALMIEGAPVRYTAVSPGEFCASRIRRLEESRIRLLEVLPERRKECGSYMTIRGRDNILDRLRELIAGVDERVYLSVSGKVLTLVGDEIGKITGAGKKMVVITDSEAAAVFARDPRFSGAKIYQGAVKGTLIRAIADSRFVLTGELEGGAAASCLFSDQHNLVELFKDALSNELRLIELEAGK